MNNLPTVTKNLLIINVLMFLATIVVQGRSIDLGDYLGLHFVLSDRFNAAQLITYMFMHGGFTHLFFNMFAVWMFGRILEQVWGPKRFLFYYLMCGIGAALIQEGVNAVAYTMATEGLSPEAIDVVVRERRTAVADELCRPADGPPEHHAEQSDGGGFRGCLCHSVGIRYALSQPTDVHLPAAVPYQSQVSGDGICPD